MPARIATNLIQPVTPSLGRKLSKVIEEDEPEIIPVGIRNVKHLFQTFVAMIFIAFVVHITRSYIWNINQRMERKKMKKIIRQKRKPRYNINRANSEYYQATQRLLDARYATRNSGHEIEWQSARVTRIFLGMK